MDKEYSVFVNAAAIVLAPCALRRTEVDDLMNSVLLAQLVADKSLLRAPAVDWYATYLEVLSVAWISVAKRRKDLQPQKKIPIRHWSGWRPSPWMIRWISNSGSWR